MRNSRLLLFAAALALLGAGCFATRPEETERLAEPLTHAALEYVVPQRQGFGKLPRFERPPRYGSGSVRIDAELPVIPPEMTVLRVRHGRPNETELRNITKSLLIPIGLLGENAQADEIVLSWRDKTGERWQYFGSERRVEYSAPTTTTVMVSENKTIQSIALGFMGDRGLDLKKLSAPGVEGDKVRFYALQDGLAVKNADGSSVVYAELAIDQTRQKVTQAILTLPLDPDRSDYETISAKRAAELMASGGLGGTPPGNVTIHRAEIAWVRLEDKASTPLKRYLVPALVGTGSLNHEDGTEPYTIVVPLTK